MQRATQKPDHEALFGIAAAQEGHFTTAQAAKAGFSSQLLHKYLGSKKILRIRHGVYRLVQYPPGDHEDLVAIWLWSGRAGVFSHETALAAQDLSDALPSKVHLTLPASWRRRRLRVPRGVVLHHADIEATRRIWIGPVPVTDPEHTLADCVSDRVSPELVRQAFETAADRGHIDRRSLPEVIAYLEQFFEKRRSQSGPTFRERPMTP